MKSVRLFLLPLILLMTGCPVEEDLVAPDEFEDYELLLDVRDGNQYRIAKIGSQKWMAENLRYRGELMNGDDESIWYQSWSLKRPTYSIPNFPLDSIGKYGLVYNWFAVSPGETICPPEWRIPTNKDWDILIEYLGGQDFAGAKMKATKGWKGLNSVATNESGFSAYPVEWRDAMGNFIGSPSTAYFWSLSSINDNSGFMACFHQVVQAKWTMRRTLVCLVDVLRTKMEEN